MDLSLAGTEELLDEIVSRVGKRQDMSFVYYLRQAAGAEVASESEGQTLVNFGYKGGLHAAYGMTTELKYRLEAELESSPSDWE